MALFDLGFTSNDRRFNEDLRRILYANEHGLNISYTGINALKNSDVFTAVKVISEDIASTSIMTKGHETDEAYNRILKLINDSPDGELPGWHFKFIIIANMLLNGNFMLIVRDKRQVFQRNFISYIIVWFLLRNKMVNFSIILLKIITVIV